MCHYAGASGDTGRMPADAPTAPTDEQWHDLGFSAVTELDGGWQSRVFAVRDGRGSLAVKLTQADLVDRHELEHKTALVDDLARLDHSVVPPAPVCGSLVYPFGDWLVTATQLIVGDRLDASSDAHCGLLGAALAELHRSMRRLPTVDIPTVAALRSDIGERWDSAESAQLLHGDFSTSNLILTGTGIRIFDFDDCGYGPVEFDVANSIYMVAFDSWTNDDSLATVRAFRSAVVDGYARSARRSLDTEKVDSLIDMRVMALQQWATNPATAPIGIRNSPPEWIETLRRFAGEWLQADGGTARP